MASRGHELDQDSRERAELLDVAAGLARTLAAGDHGYLENRFLRSLAVIPFVPATKVRWPSRAHPHVIYMSRVSI